MNKETEIKAKLSYIFSHVVKGLDGDVKDIIEKEGIIAGGAIRSLYTGAKINDIDIYLQNPESAKKVKDYINNCLSTQTGFFTKMNIMRLLFANQLKKQPDYISDNAWSFTNQTLGLRIQIIYRFTGKPMELINRFDFTNSRAVYIPQDDNLVMPNDFKVAILEKRLIFNPDCHSPVYSLDRMFKFVRGGYTIDRKNLLKLCKAAADDTNNHANFSNGGDMY
jgi:hypothetical protein